MYLGDFVVGSVVRFLWNTSDSNGASITRSTDGTVSVYKDGGTTQSTTGVSGTEDFDGLTGVHLCAIDTSADGTFYSAGSDFAVVLSAATIDTRTVNAVLGHFSLANRSALRPTTAGRTLDVSAGGEAGVDWANVGSPTTSVTLSGTTVKTATDVETDTADIQSRLPAALVSGRMDASVGAMAANVVTASAIAADAIGASELAADAVAEIADGVWDEARAGHVAAGSFGEGVSSVQGNVTGSAASVVGDVGGNVVGSVASVTAGVTVTTNNDKTGYRLSATGVDDVWDEAQAGHVTAGTFGQNLDDQVSLKLATSAYTAPDNASITAIKAKTDNLPDGIRKNTALANFEFLMLDAADHVSPKTGLTITAERSIDGGAFAACTNAAAEVASGVYKLSLAAADLNGDVVTFKFTATGADARYITVVTQT